MAFGAEAFSPTGPLGATRAAVVARVQQRRRRTMSVALAALVAVVFVAAAVSLSRSGNATSLRVASQGADHPTQTVPVSDGGVPTTGPSTSSSVVTETTLGGVSPRSFPVTVAPPASGPVAPVRTVPTTVAPGPTPTTTPQVTTPATTAVLASSSVGGTVLFSPTCPVQQVTPTPACAPKPGAAHIQLVRADGTTAAQGDAGADGQFRIQVAPGSYAVRATAPTPSAISRGCTANPSQVTVASGMESSVAVSCDTGIR
jgi:hypothetical protein